jgi:ribosome biogenesis GTPase A
MAAQLFSSRYGGTINWFPGHMFKATMQLREAITRADVVVELRDARVPFSSMSPVFEKLCEEARFEHRRVVALSKSDLACPQLQTRVLAGLKSRGVSASAFIDCRSGLHVGRLLHAVDSIHPRGSALVRSSLNPGTTALIIG